MSSFALLLLFGVSAPTSAQQDSSAVSLSTDGGNRRYFVRLITGQEITGQFLQGGRDEVRLRISGRERIIPLDEVDRVERSGDTLKNGALIGAVIVGAWCALVCGQGLDSATQLPVAVAVNAGVGALIGIGIDAAHQGRTIVYQRLSPLRGHAPQASLSFRFRF